MKRIYLYLFVFSLAINVFLYRNAAKIMEEKDQHIELLEKKLKQAEDSIQSLQKISTPVLTS
ncbi:MAG TPA: hypothetical protein VLY87_01195 [Flavobacterium sp.]|nr:hypothetical protein [Flavobacterium sp.]